MSRHIVLGILLSAVTSVCTAAASLHLLDVRVDLNEKPSLQHGAKLFVNYCMSCHSLEYMRYKRMGEDLGLTDEQVGANLMFAADKVVEPMSVAMRQVDAARWFGVPPPDLSVIARSRGANWLYSYLVSFYEDPNPTRPFGVNNVVFPQVGMPHALWPLQGHQRYVRAEVAGTIVSEHTTGIETAADGLLVQRDVVLDSGDTLTVIDRLEVSTAGKMSAGEFRSAARDLVNFLVYASEPAQLARSTIGIWVLLFLAVLYYLSRALYKEYWKDVH